MTNIHSCSYQCQRPDCIKRQRDELFANLAKCEINAGRYEVVRKMNVREFSDLYLLNITTNQPFDELVDDLKQQSV